MAEIACELPRIKSEGVVHRLTEPLLGCVCSYRKKEGGTHNRPLQEVAWSAERGIAQSLDAPATPLRHQTPKISFVLLSTACKCGGPCRAATFRSSCSMRAKSCKMKPAASTGRPTARPRLIGVCAAARDEASRCLRAF